MTDTPHQHSLFGESNGDLASKAAPPVLPSGGRRREAPPAPAQPLPRRLYLTADLRAATGLARTAMDFYLRSGVVRPSSRTESGYLLFDDDELELLRKVIAWRSRGLSLKEIKAYIGRQNASEERLPVEPFPAGAR